MAQTAVVRARIDVDIKEQAEELFADIGISTSQAISILFRKAIQDGGIVVDLRRPSQRLKRAIGELEAGEGVYHEGVDSLMNELKS